MSTTLPDSETIRRTAREVLQQSDYNLDPPEETSWVTEWVARAFEKIRVPINWLYEHLSGLPNWVQWILLVVLIGVVIWGLNHLRQHWRLGHAVLPPASPDAHLELSSPDELDRLATEAALQEDYVVAVRMLLRASILRLENAEGRINRPGTTNRELLRRYRKTPIAHDLALLVETVNLKWYGSRQCTSDEYLRCQEASVAIRQQSLTLRPAKQPAMA